MRLRIPDGKFRRRPRRFRFPDLSCKNFLEVCVPRMTFCKVEHHAVMQESHRTANVGAPRKTFITFLACSRVPVVIISPGGLVVKSSVHR
ncbi:hypothetical protein LSAT2_020013 [Lamellibrachia satsuma]|nr:hypothetical protein LSAT2_020013 [Lamellibrachia satsuma]